MNITLEIQKLDDLIIEHTKPPVTAILRNKLHPLREQIEAYITEKQNQELAVKHEIQDSPPDKIELGILCQLAKTPGKTNVASVAESLRLHRTKVLHHVERLQSIGFVVIGHDVGDVIYCGLSPKGREFAVEGGMV